MSLNFGQIQFGGGEVFGVIEPPAAPVVTEAPTVGPLFERILYELLFPGNKQGASIAKEVKVISMSAGTINTENTSNIDSSGPTPKSNRNLIFE